MRRFVAAINRFLRSRGFRFSLLAIVGLIALFYAEEDWRGARAWAATKAKWEARGESLDYNNFIPPPVPDNQNLAAIPLFKLEPVKGDDGKSYLAAVSLRHAMRDDLSSLDLTVGNSKKGEVVDLPRIRDEISSGYSAAFKGAKPPASSMAQFNSLFPFLSDFLAAASTHPNCRINENYAVSPPFARPFGPLTDPIKLAKILTIQAILAVDEHQGDLALRDVATNITLASGTGRDPSLVGGLVSIGVIVINNAAVYDGLAGRVWNDTQLAQLEAQLKSMDFLAGFRLSMRGEAAASKETLDYLHKNGARSLGERNEMSSLVNDAGLFPDGWWDENKIRIVAFRLQQVATVDPQARRVFPQLADDLQRQAHQAAEAWDSYAPWKIFANISNYPVAGATIQFAKGQVLVDEARIACALERYHLAQGVYPATLDALTPYIDQLPHDIMTGQPYRYQLRPDGTYLLYSVGWNQTDDGGKIVYQKDVPTQIDYTQGDWVWPTPR